MSLDYSKVVMIGNGWARRQDDGELKMFPSALEAAGGVAESIPEKEPVKPELFDVFKLTDGQRGKRASIANVTRGDAEAYANDRPEEKYDIVAAD